MRHLIDPTDLSMSELDEIINLALDIIDNREKYAEACKGKKLATLFYEPSTRTRLSFTSAMLELGGSVLGFSDAKSSSVAKGETCADTTKTISCFADIIAMRHFEEGAALVAAMNARVPVINAGDGSHSHPTQTLTDLLTIKREVGRFDNLTIGFCGDLRFGRTVHSLIKAMSRYEGVKVVLIAPEQLRLPSYMKQEVCDKNNIPYVEVSSMEEVMGDLDILYMTRVQKERFLDEDEFDRLKDSFILDAEKLKKARPEMRVLHALPSMSIKIPALPTSVRWRMVSLFVWLLSSSCSSGLRTRARLSTLSLPILSAISMYVATSAASRTWRPASSISSVLAPTSPASSAAYTASRRQNCRIC